MRTAKLVENILESSREARNSDIELIIKVWEQEGLFFSEKQRVKLKSVSKPETIRRLRQKLQEQGKYRADEAIEEQRYNKYIGMKHSDRTIDKTEEALKQPRAISWLNDEI